jgi:hypothetical protein
MQNEKEDSMPVQITINDAAQAVLEIADAEAELHQYRFRLAAPGLSVWALEVTRADTNQTYRVEETTPGKWECSCEAFRYRKRGAPVCKHALCIKLLKSWLNDFLREETKQSSLRKAQ